MKTTAHKKKHGLSVDLYLAKIARGFEINWNNETNSEAS